MSTPCIYPSCHYERIHEFSQLSLPVGFIAAKPLSKPCSKRKRFYSLLYRTLRTLLLHISLLSALRNQTKRKEVPSQSRLWTSQSNKLPPRVEMRRGRMRSIISGKSRRRGRCGCLVWVVDGPLLLVLW